MASREKVSGFVAWCASHVTGDEKGQAQIFLDRLFQAFGQPGCLDGGGTTEFPWPQFELRSSRRKSAQTSAPKDQSGLTSAATIAKIDAVATAARELRRVRAEALPKMKDGLRALYRTLELPGANPLKEAHAALDTAVLTAYGFSAKKDLLAQLLALNQEVAAKFQKGEPVTAPGVPKNFPDAKQLVTEDCIRPASP